MAGNNSFMTNLFGLLDDDEYMKDVPSQPPSSTDLVDVKYYLSIIEELLDLATAVADNTQPKGDQVQSKSSTLTSTGISASLSSTVNELGRQITCEAQHTNDVRPTMELLLGYLSAFSWDTKAVLALLASTVHYADKWCLAQIEESNALFRLTGILKGSFVIGNSLDKQRRAEAFMAFNNLIRVALKFIQHIVQNDSKDFREFAASIDISGCFKYIIVIVLGCSVLFSGMISAGNEFLGLDLSPFFNHATKRYEVFVEYVRNYKQVKEEKLQYERIEKINECPAGILKLMAEMFCTEKDPPTVYQCFKKTTVNVEELQNKNVMLLISDLNLSNEDLVMLNAIYNASTFKSSNYEILWVPMADIKEREKFLKKRSQMSWYSCNSIVNKAAAKFIENRWQFKRQTKVVVLDQEGKVVNMDAMTMIRPWGLEAFQIMPQSDHSIWRHWVNLVVNEKSWEPEQLIFLYGSAEDSEIVKKIDDILRIELADYNIEFFNINAYRKEFLSRLENCTRMEIAAHKGVADSLGQELLKLSTSYEKQGGFAIVVKKGSVIVNTSLTNLWKVLSEHRSWIKETNGSNIDTHFHAYYKEVMVGDMLECIKCPTANCPRNMETAVTSKCCHSKH